MGNKLVVRQYAYGLMRIDDGSVVNIHNPNKDKNGKPIIYTDFPFEVSADVGQNGNIQPVIYLPPDNTLFVNGQDVMVNPLAGGRVAGQNIYPIPLNSSLWCAVFPSIVGGLSAQIFNGQGGIPQDSIARFFVAFVPRDPQRDKVVQYAYGTQRLYVDGGIFTIVPDGYSHEDPSEGADDDDSSEEAEQVSLGIARDSASASSAITHHFENTYYMVGERLFDAGLDGTTVEDYSGKFVCLKLNATVGSHNATLVGYDTLEELQADQSDPRFVIKPLYKLGDGGNVEVDFRTGPRFQMAEVL